MLPVYENSTNSLVKDARFSRGKLAISQMWRLSSPVGALIWSKDCGSLIPGNKPQRLLVCTQL